MAPAADAVPHPYHEPLRSLLSKHPGGRRDEMIDIPLPMAEGRRAWIRMPSDGLDTFEVDRIGQLIQALVVVPRCRRCGYRMSWSSERGKWRCHHAHAEVPQ